VSYIIRVRNVADKTKPFDRAVDRQGRVVGANWAHAFDGLALAEEMAAFVRKTNSQLVTKIVYRSRLTNRG
jgi:hypothetical protein